MATGPQPFPLLLGAALAALLTARALHPSVSVISAAVLAFAQWVTHPVELLVLSAVLSVLAVLEQQPAVFQRLAGGRKFAAAATLSAMATLFMAVVQWPAEIPMAALFAGVVVLPLLWTRANRHPVFAAFAPQYVLLAVLTPTYTPPYAPYLILLAPLVLRAVEHVPAFGRLLLGREDAKARAELSGFMQGSLVLAGLVLVPMTMGNPVPLSCLATALVLMPGPKPSLRFGAAAGFLLFVPQARPLAAGLLLALGYLEHHRPAAVWAALRSPLDVWLRPVAGLSALALVGVGVFNRPTPGPSRCWRACCWPSPSS